MTNISDRMKWDRRFLRLAKTVANWSKDPSTKCGAVVALDKKEISLGYNGFPSGCNDHISLYEDRGTKYERIIHAEVNAIVKAKQPLDGCTLYTVPFPPCSRCTAIVIQAGIKRVVSIQIPETSELYKRWEKSLKFSADMYAEAGVETAFYYEEEVQWL